MFWMFCKNVSHILGIIAVPVTFFLELSPHFWHVAIFSLFSMQMSQTLLRRFTWTSLSWRNGSNLSSKYSLNVLCPAGWYKLARTGPSTTIPSTVGFISWVLHLSYRLSSKSVLSPDKTFPSLLKEGGTEVFF